MFRPMTSECVWSSSQRRTTRSKSARITQLRSPYRAWMHRPGSGSDRPEPASRGRCLSVFGNSIGIHGHGRSHDDSGLKGYTGPLYLRSCRDHGPVTLMHFLLGLESLPAFQTRRKADALAAVLGDPVSLSIREFFLLAARPPDEQQQARLNRLLHAEPIPPPDPSDGIGSACSRRARRACCTPSRCRPTGLAAESFWSCRATVAAVPGRARPATSSLAAVSTGSAVSSGD